MSHKSKSNQILLVEGNDDQHVIWALCNQHQILETFEVIDCKGISNLIEQVPIRFKQSGLKTIGIIIDADSEISSRWDTLKSILSKHNINAPDKLTEDGLIVIQENQIKIGVWIMPNNNLNGMLEDFISFLIPENDKLLPMVKSNLQQVELQKMNKYSTIHHSKALIHSWLALQEDPGTPMGLSITKRYLTTTEDTCIKLITWLKLLFE